MFLLVRQVRPVPIEELGAIEPYRSGPVSACGQRIFGQFQIGKESDGYPVAGRRGSTQQPPQGGLAPIEFPRAVPIVG
jgi:hypothetical protein